MQCMKVICPNYMSKLDENGQPIVREDGKILKGKSYKEADVKSILFV